MGLPVEVNSLMMGSLGGYTIGRSLRFRSSASAYLNRTPASNGNQQKWTVSFWYKPGRFGSQQPILASYSSTTNYAVIGLSLNAFYNSSDTLKFLVVSSNVAQATFETTAVYRDPSAWYHVVIAVDTTQATSTNRVGIYVNGVQVTSFITATYPAQNTNLVYINTTNAQQIGAFATGTYGYYDGYMAEFNFVDGQQLTPSSFGAYDTNGVWQPKKYTGTYGTNGFYLPFSNTTSTTTLVQDLSGNGNNWTPNNISLTAGSTYDSMIDSPTVSASSSNYAVLNPLSKASPVSLTSGNLNASSSSGSDNLAYSTIFTNAIKFYAEMQPTTTPGRYSPLGFGVRSPVSPTNQVTFYITNYSGDGPLYWNNGSSGYIFTGGSAPYAYTASTSDIFQVACDPSTGKVWLGKNNSWFDSSGGVTGNPSTGSNPTYTFSTASLNLSPVITTSPYSATDGSTGSGLVNFGQRPFSYTPPSGYNALNTYNLPAATINNGALYMAATTYAGTGNANGDTLTVSNGNNNTLGTTFQPDLVWVKTRDGSGGTATNLTHILADSLRGTSNLINSNTTNAEYSGGGITSFNSNGFTAQRNTTYNQNNVNGWNYIGWQWKAGGTGVTNNSGTITSTVSANPTAGFSIVTYTGTGANATVGHGLGVAPSMIILKNRTTSPTDWAVWQTTLSATEGLSLNTTGAKQTGLAVWWNSTLPTSSVFSIGTSATVNNNSNTYVAYCFAAVSGYSAFGSYSGSGSADGPFIFTGFRPRFVMAKCSTSTISASWLMQDSSRDTYNVGYKSLYANETSVESVSSNDNVDFLSNGFKIRNASSAWNNSGQTFIYMAFAENPFRISRAR
jgi:hypothetical protein